MFWRDLPSLKDTIGGAVFFIALPVVSFAAVYMVAAVFDIPLQ